MTQYQIFDRLAVKPLEWSDNSADGYRLFNADSFFGRFSYGRDTTGQAYFQAPPDVEIDLMSESDAKGAAEAFYANLVLEKIKELTVPVQTPELPRIEPKVLAAVRELRASLKKYADDCDEARLWGGPTINPPNPINEDVARRYAKQIGDV